MRVPNLTWLSSLLQNANIIELKSISNHYTIQDTQGTDLEG